jgi:hypothetical protein
MPRPKCAECEKAAGREPELGESHGLCAHHKQRMIEDWRATMGRDEQRRLDDITRTYADLRTPPDDGRYEQIIEIERKDGWTTAGAVVAGVAIAAIVAGMAWAAAVIYATR